MQGFGWNEADCMSRMSAYLPDFEKATLVMPQMMLSWEYMLNSCNDNEHKFKEFSIELLDVIKKKLYNNVTWLNGNFVL